MGPGLAENARCLAGVFLTGYGLARSFVEMFRQPDQQFVTADNPIGHALHFGEWGLTMGQLLSMPMVLVGLALIVFALRERGRTAPPRRAAM